MKLNTVLSVTSIRWSEMAMNIASNLLSSSLKIWTTCRSDGESNRRITYDVFGWRTMPGVGLGRSGIESHSGIGGQGREDLDGGIKILKLDLSCISNPKS